jgi:probable HAF family extracellular repeat protein
VVVACVVGASAQGTYTQIDVPGAFWTQGSALNDSGDIVGTYYDTRLNAFGFLLSKGVFTTIVYPSSAPTFLAGLNNFGKIVGYTTNPPVGFLYDSQSQTFTVISDPNAETTLPLSINDAGTIVGQAEHNHGVFAGFELLGSTYRLIMPPGSEEAFAVGVSAVGQIAGFGTRSSNLRNFVIRNNRISYVAFPDTPGAQVNGINSTGTTLVGFYHPATGVTTGFLYQNRVLSTLQFPGSLSTYAEGVNAAGDVVGDFIDADGVFHGFLYTPSKETH